MKLHAIVSIALALSAPLGIACSSDPGREAPDTRGDDTDVAPPDTSIDVEVAAPEDGLAIVGVAQTTVAPRAAIDLSIDWPGHEDDIASVQWSVTPPIGPAPEFAPDLGARMSYRVATFVGTYRFDAVVTDRAGATHRARYFDFVVVPPAVGLYAELSWHTPGDVNELDGGGDQIYYSAGTDLDLHVIDTGRGEKYFDERDDCYSMASTCEWGTRGTDDNPTLFEDDTDGLGPEAIGLTTTAPDAVYRIGVDYWNDFAYGDSWATLRVYWNGVLRDEWADVELTLGDLWDAYTVDGSGTVTRVGAVPAIYHGFEKEVPRVSIVADSGTAVTPGATVGLHLETLDSAAAPDFVDWSVVGPDGQTTALPAGADPLVTSWQPVAVGRYEVQASAHVPGEGPVPSARLDIAVAVATNLRIELTWRTPGDPDETDLAFGKDAQDPKGSDLDLHLMRAVPDGRWFVPYDDCYANGASFGTCSWGAPGAFDDPYLFGDDYDGGGPEVISLAALEPGLAYTVGVHFWNDNGFGDAFATLRIFLNGALAGEWADVPMTNDDLWSAFTIVDTAVTRIGSDPSIEHDYRGGNQP